jgi:UDPglucose 6-dehydrogenase
LAQESDALVVVTEWQEFRTLDLASLAGRMATRILVDGRNLYTAEAATAAGFDYTGIGRLARTRTPEQREARGTSD